MRACRPVEGDILHGVGAKDHQFADVLIVGGHIPGIIAVGQVPETDLVPAQRRFGRRAKIRNSLRQNLAGGRPGERPQQLAHAVHGPRPVGADDPQLSLVGWLGWLFEEHPVAFSGAGRGDLPAVLGGLSIARGNGNNGAAGGPFRGLGQGDAGAFFDLLNQDGGRHRLRLGHGQSPRNHDGVAEVYRGPVAQRGDSRR